MLFKQKCKKKLLRKPTYVIVRGGRKFCGWETGEEPDDPVTSAATDRCDLGRLTFPRALTRTGFGSLDTRSGTVGCLQKCWAARFPLGCSKRANAVFSRALDLTFCSSAAMKVACSERGVVGAGRAAGSDRGDVMAQTSRVSVLAVPHFLICRIFSPQESTVSSCILKSPVPQGIWEW